MVFNQLGNVFDGVQNLQATVRTVVDSTPCHLPFLIMILLSILIAPSPQPPSPAA
jgi:hypothetical protein